MPPSSEPAPAVRSVGEQLSAAARDLLSPQAQALRAASRSPATLAAYASDWAHFARWCQTHDHRALPASPATVANYLADCAPHWREATEGELARTTGAGQAAAPGPAPSGPATSVSARSSRAASGSAGSSTAGGARGDTGGGARSDGDRVRGRRYRAGAKPSTLRRRLVSIRHRHHAEDHPDPTGHRDVREVLAGITHLEAAAGRKVAAAATHAPLLAMLSTTTAPDASLEAAHDAGLLPDTFDDLRPDPRDARDAAILTVGMVGALRRSELAALQVGDIRFVPAGVEVYLRRSKIDQAGRGHVVDLPTLGGPTCPVAALRRWLHEWLPIARPDTPLFRRIRRDQGGDPARRVSEQGLSPRSIAEVVTRRAAAAPNRRRDQQRQGKGQGEGQAVHDGQGADDGEGRGLDGQWSGHSLRRGFATGAYAGGADEVEIMRHGRWRSASTMRSYLEEGTRFRDTHAAHHLIPDPTRHSGARGT